VNAQHIASLYHAKARAELLAADAVVPRSDAVAWRGDLLAGVMLVVGEPSDGDRRERSAATGAIGDAAAKALAALGIGDEPVLALCSRPAEADAASAARRLELAVEAVDPRLVLALDTSAAADLAAAFGVDALEPGCAVRARGRFVATVGDLGASLQEGADKAAVWQAFRSVARAALPETHARRR
jgi:hypothetical protein